MIAAIAMRYKRTLRLMFLCALSSCLYAEVPLSQYESDMDDLLLECGASSHPETLTEAEVIKFLDWINVPDNACGGYFKPKKAMSDVQKNSDVVRFQADDSSQVGITGVSYLQGNVHVRYKESQLNADKSCYFRAQAPEANDAAYAEGHVRFSHNNLVALADRVLWYINGGSYLHGAHFAFHAPGKGAGAAWGYAEDIWRADKDTLAFHAVDYSYCGMDNPIWQFRANYLSLDQKNMQGFLSDGVLKLFGWPVFYMPVFSFPLDDSRKTGFLYPRFDYSNTAGWLASIPYYWNLATNYDWLTTLNIYEKRGLGWSGIFRYLTERSSGKVTFMQWFHDSVFAQFKTDMANTYAGNTDPSISILENTLLSDSLNRRFLQLPAHSKCR